MNMEIEYLERLEADLKDAAANETARAERVALQGAIQRSAGRTWVKVAGAAAAFLVVAGAIGFLAQGGLIGGAADEFQQVGDAVAGGGGAGVAEGGEAPAAPAPADDAGRERLFEDQPLFGENLGDEADSRNGRGQQQDLSKVVRDGRIGIVVADGKFGDAVGDVTFIAAKYGGFILSSSSDNDRSGTFVLRIPAKRFDRAIGDIRDLAAHVRFQQIQGDDVTAEFIDQQARLRILQMRKALLFDLFQQADTTEEILRLGSQVDDVQLRIEQIQGQLRFINDQVAESTLRVSIQERNAPKAAAPTDVDNPDLGSSVDLAVQGFLRIVGAVIVGLGYLVPLTLLGAIAWFVVWAVRRSRTLS